MPNLTMISKLNLLLLSTIDQWDHRIHCIQIVSMPSSVAVTDSSSSKMLTTDNRLNKIR